MGEKLGVVNTDSQIIVALLKNSQICNTTIEQIKAKSKRLQENGWTIHIDWVKAHVGLNGNEIADQLAKEAAQEDSEEVIYNKIPRSHIIREAEEKGLYRWQDQWEKTTKPNSSKGFFPIMQERLKLRIPLNVQIRAILSGHGLGGAQFLITKLRTNMPGLNPKSLRSAFEEQACMTVDSALSSDGDIKTSSPLGALR
ncbi:hypothetical protein ANN_26794 [Periplaneta americana]|uniref:RNase H type-1 domain-containing protein n=1 Tax=Periplaneta americana TaxID=6978 RepID=A0ABQ8RZD7_PERAM|nr:hypothetical protein ANN_26794 [Periplaneta americana]